MHDMPSRTAPWGDEIHFLPADRSLEAQFREQGISWPHELAALRGIVTPGSTVLDVGAHIGYLSCFFSHLVGQAGEVHAFEPATALLSVLRFNTACTGRNNVIVNALAVGEMKTQAELWVPSGKFGRQSLCRANVPDVCSSEWVEVVALDEYVAAQLPGRPIDLLKVDVEGGESSVLRGAQRTLRTTRNIWLELWPEGIERFGGDPYEPFDILQEQGFTISQWDLVTGDHEIASSRASIELAIERMALRSGADRERFLPILYLHAWRPNGAARS